MRARLHVQDRDGFRRDRRERHADRHVDRYEPRRDPRWRRRHRRIRKTQLRRPVLRRRHRQVEQRRGGQDWVSGRSLPAQSVRAAVRVWPADLARFSRRESRHRVGSGEMDGPRPRLGVDGLSGRRDAAADGGGRRLDYANRGELVEPRVVRRCIGTTGGMPSGRRC